MGLSPGRQCPDFALVDDGNSMRFRDWGSGRWGIVVTSLAEFTTESLQAGTRRAAQSQAYIVEIEQALSGDAASEAQVAGHETYENIAVVRDFSGQIAKRWRGTPPEVGPEDEAVPESIAYIIDGRGRICLTKSYIPGSCHDFLEVVRTLEELRARSQVAVPLAA